MWLVSHRAAACHRTRLFRASHGQTGSYEPGAAHVTHLIQSDNNECKVKSRRLHNTCRSRWVMAIVYAPEPRLI